MKCTAQLTRRFKPLTVWLAFERTSFSEKLLSLYVVRLGEASCRWLNKIRDLYRAELAYSRLWTDQRTKFFRDLEISEQIMTLWQVLFFNINIHLFWPCAYLPTLPKCITTLFALLDLTKIDEKHPQSWQHNSLPLISELSSSPAVN